MGRTSLAGTDLSREILGEVLDERGKPGSISRQQATFAEKVQAAIDQGASLDELRRHFRLSESELRDFCSDIMDDDFDDSGPESASGY